MLKPVQDITQDWSLERIVKERTPITWEKPFEDAHEELMELSEILDNLGEYCPLKRDIFHAFQCTKLNKVKVVIIGMDPYPQMIEVKGEIVPRAVGMSFSVRREDEIPKSLINIYKELDESVDNFNKPDHGDLTSWALQGVLLLNASLTVKEGKPGSHGTIWHGFLKKIIKWIISERPKTLWVLWGNDAGKLGQLIGQKAPKLTGVHPVAFGDKFKGCDHFNQINEYLKKIGEEKIDWNVY